MKPLSVLFALVILVAFVPTTFAQEETPDDFDCVDAVFAELDSLGVERTTEKGTVRLHEKVAPLLAATFPDWSFYEIKRELEIEGGISYDYMQYDLAACRSDTGGVLILSDLSMESTLENELSIIHDAGLTIASQDDIETLAAALDALYYDGTEVEGVERLDEATWAVYTGTFFGKKKGFVLTVDEDGTISELKYRLKIGEE
ncbi:MAG: hypothetical protein GF405_06320 [Candidatus Eisenbacteria bacterium]|nr:hypothetical protein [Candidatus Eisenbacteria bacterium]